MLPQGYALHELPADYSGPIWIEGQLRQFERAVTERDTLILEWVLVTLEDEGVRGIDNLLTALRKRLDETLTISEQNHASE